MNHEQRAKNAMKLVESYGALDRSIIVYGIAPLFQWFAPLQAFYNEKTVPFEVFHCPAHLERKVKTSNDLEHLRIMTKRKKDDIWLIVIPKEK
jgi:hypothetical protein